MPLGVPLKSSTPIKKISSLMGLFITPLKAVLCITSQISINEADKVSSQDTEVRSESLDVKVTGEVGPQASRAPTKKNPPATLGEYHFLILGLLCAGHGEILLGVL